MDKRALYEQHKAPAAEANGHVCVCMGIAKDTIKDAIENGAKSFEDIKSATTAGAGCSLCEPVIEDIITG